MTSKRRAKGEQTALLPELPPELWNKITKHLTLDFNDCASVRLLNKRNAEEYEWEMLHAGFRAELDARRRKFEAKRVSDDAHLEADNPMRLAHLSRLQGDLCGEGRLHVFMLGMVRECMNHLKGGVHPLRLALIALRKLRSV